MPLQTPGLLLLMGQRLLHQHHLDALLHGVLLGPLDRLQLLRTQLGGGANAGEAVAVPPSTGPEDQVAGLHQVGRRGRPGPVALGDLGPLPAGSRARVRAEGHERRGPGGPGGGGGLSRHRRGGVEDVDVDYNSRDSFLNSSTFLVIGKKFRFFTKKKNKTNVVRVLETRGTTFLCIISGMS